MDRRNWPWRKKSSEKSPGETESSGSISDEQVQTNLTYNSQSPEVASRTARDDEENEKISTLTDKLSAALLDIAAKEDLVKQHAKVAEEAVAGWERAEKEASSFNLQLDAALKKNSALDGALKECVRQLRQGKEEREQRIEEAIAKREQEWESRKSELESQLKELSTQLEAAKSSAAAEKENSSMRIELVGLKRKLEITSVERDLSIQSAETASKQQLECVKKVAKLEAECRRLRFLARKVSVTIDHRSVKPESLTDSHSDCGETSNVGDSDKLKGVKESERVLMDDFLEMERLAASPEGPSNVTGENPKKTEIEEMITRNADLEKKIRRLETEKLDLEMQLDKCHGELKDENMRSIGLEDKLSECEAQLRTSHGQLKATRTELMSLQSQLFECQDQLRKSQAKLKGTETELIELQTQLFEHEDRLKEKDDQLSISLGQLKDTEASLMELKMKLTEREEQLRTSQVEVEHVEDEFRKLQTQLFEREDEVKTCQGQLEDAQSELIKVKAQLVASEEELKRSQGQVLEMQTQLIEYEKKLEESESKLIELQMDLAMADKLKEVAEGELKASNARREEAELQVQVLESEVESLMAKVKSSVDEPGKQDLSSDIEMKSGNELPRRRLESQFQLAWNCNTDMKAEQEKELAVAASKLEECQKTIASLGRQLQSLATLDDFLEEDEDSSLDFSRESPIYFRTGEPPSIDCSN